jgi:beta-lactamase regulating signal transducer with metallopeptidase domain
MMGHDQYIPFNAPELSGDEIRKRFEESKADTEALDKLMDEIRREFGRKILKAIQEAEANPQPPWLF